ncbi:hypothetical protein H6P81_018979 [Aristolochia fimbriata]|uniref:Polynucleotide adenylyltransferase n=1 Tax=Aristolochia fimbriata TaxID=158543 RepID=A0AAV7E4S2_ARIFI|nr:hypothetical protein H6P81_018979 [Aristolochia fimbriata]
MAVIRRNNNLFPLHFVSRPHTPTLASLQKLVHTLVKKAESARPYGQVIVDNELEKGQYDSSSWKSVDSRSHGIKGSMVSPHIWTVLGILRKKGFDSYLVGGCVRDLLLKRTPKDFDVVTTATLQQVKKQFRRCLIVGRRFPICHVHINGSIVEVSSFGVTDETCVNKDILRWRDCMRRDFTINSLFYDPFKNKIYDYSGGIGDLMMQKLRTVIPANLSFTEDCARILRGLRVAARLGMAFYKDTEAAIRDLSPSIMNLAKDRLMMELNFMLAYGAAEPSLHMLQRFKLLDILLPVHAAYLAEQDKKCGSGRANMMMSLFSNMDKLLGCDRPSDCSLWVGLLAFHLALVNHPQDAFVLWVFALTLYNGEWKKAVKFARENTEVFVQFIPEVLESSGVKSDEFLENAISLLVTSIKSSVNALTDMEPLIKSMAKYPSAPSPSLAIIPKRLGKTVSKLFDVLETDIRSYASAREGPHINYKLLAQGDPRETRFVLGKIIMNAMSNRILGEEGKETTNHNYRRTMNVIGRVAKRQRKQEVSEARQSRSINEKNVNIVSFRDVQERELNKTCPVCETTKDFRNTEIVQDKKHEVYGEENCNRPLSSLFV